MICIARSPILRNILYLIRDTRTLYQDAIFLFLIICMPCAVRASNNSLLCLRRVTIYCYHEERHYKENWEAQA
ncbi:hypothetical protein BDV24DRAFT_141211 [Aspergillus arachidicola]|uniref:Uncharacterized protein n=1 Tax=Aspergillus arachidicola TaxID=656916 RepID=A0A5N6XUA0_9EURO|nr:hypothetical protein BDV24DRAFT_141211 [Aspergillus arachidicola]